MIGLLATYGKSGPHQKLVVPYRYQVEHVRSGDQSVFLSAIASSAQVKLPGSSINLPRETSHGKARHRSIILIIYHLMQGKIGAMHAKACCRINQGQSKHAFTRHSPLFLIAKTQGRHAASLSQLNFNDLIDLEQTLPFLLWDFCGPYSTSAGQL